MKDFFFRVMDQTATRFWINNVTHIQADLAIASGAIGCTQNPAYTWKILNGSEDKALADKILSEIVKRERDDTKALIELQRALIVGIAEHFMPMYQSSQGTRGYVSIQGDPINEDVDTIIACARYNCSISPNIMAKIPVTEEGLEAIKVLAKERIPINATECMAVQQVIDLCDTYVEATRDVERPAPIYFSLITGIYDEYIQNYVRAKGIDIQKDILWQAGITIAKKVHRIVFDRQYPVGFIGGGARGLHHFTEMIGANASITINWNGAADKLLELDPPVLNYFDRPTLASVDDTLCEKIDEHRKAFFINGLDRKEYETFGPVVLFRSQFVEAWDKALRYIAEFRNK